MTTPLDDWDLDGTPEPYDDNLETDPGTPTADVSDRDAAGGPGPEDCEAPDA